MEDVVKELQKELTNWDYVRIVSCVAFIPTYLAWKLIMKPLDAFTRRKSRRRFLVDTTARYLVWLAVAIKRLRLLQLTGTTQLNYMTWAWWNNLPVTITELGGNARLLWIGERRTDKVILYFHGGAYVVSMMHGQIMFWRHVQKELEKRGTDVGIAILNYSLVPIEPFPTQIRQAASAVNYLISNGTPPGNIHVVGESAGGGLVLGLLSHILHPLPDIPAVDIAEPLAGMYVMSPWVRLSAEGLSNSKNVETDYITTKGIELAGSLILSGIPESLTPYIQPLIAPEGWFRDAHKHVGRFLITVGGRECFYDHVEAFARRFKEENSETRFIVQPDGLHVEPFLEFFFSESNSILVIIDWLVEGFMSKGKWILEV